MKAKVPRRVELWFFFVLLSRIIQPARPHTHTEMNRNNLPLSTLAAFIFSLSLLLCGTSSCSDDPVNAEGPTVCPEPPTPEELKSWWKEARFGLFIHYGVYSALAGEYNGPNTYGEDIRFQSYGNLNTPDATQRGTGLGAEWIMSEALIPQENYRSYASGFTATKFNPREIVDLAKKAGMKYIILTSKHHEGFCLWDSPATDWNIATSPAGEVWENDLIAPLARAAREAGLKFGLYFSQFRDWMHPGAPLPIAALTEGGSYSTEEQEEYMERYTYPMIKDLLERYDPDVFWWDGPYENTDFAARCDSLIRTYNPAILQNDRLAPESGYAGDFATPEQSMNEETVAENSELCMTLNGSWGYNRFDTNWKHPSYLLYALLRAQKLGCNLLLNIGPKADGSIPEENIRTLGAIGNWMEANEESAHKTEKSPFSYNLPYGPTTYRPSLNGRPHLFYHVFYWDGSGELWIPGILNPADELRVSIPSAPGLQLKAESLQDIGLRIGGLPMEAPDSLCTTIDIEFLAEPVLDEGTRFIQGTAYLDALGAKIASVDLGDWSSRPAILWFGGAPIKYKLKVPAEGDYEVSAELAAYFDGNITFQFNDSTKLVGTNRVTPSGHATFQWQRMGTVHLAPGTHELTVTSQQPDSWLRLRQFRLLEIR